MVRAPLEGAEDGATAVPVEAASADKPAAGVAPVAAARPRLALSGVLGPMQSYWNSMVAAEAAPTKVVTAADYPRARALAPVAAYVDNRFRVSERGSTLWTEFTGGMTTFFAMCYILALNGGACVFAGEGGEEGNGG